MWKEVNDNPAFLAEQLYRAEKCHTEKNLSPELIGFKINFWDEKVNRFKPPYISQIRLADGQFYYHFANPETQALEPPIVQPVQCEFK